MAATDLLAGLTVAGERVLQPLVAGDATADGAALDDGFPAVCPSGFSEKVGHRPAAAGPVMAHFRLSQPRVMRPGPIYPHDVNPRDTDAPGKWPRDTRAPAGARIHGSRADFGRIAATRDEAYYTSSLWRREGGAWINHFSRDWPVATIPG